MEPSQALEAIEQPAQAIENELIRTLAETKLDGTPGTESYCLELVRLLQTGRSYRALLNQQVEHGKLKAAALERKELEKTHPGKMQAGDIL